MQKYFFLLTMLIAAFSPAFPANVRISLHGADLPHKHLSFEISTDTIFQIDTVYQYEYVYDTIYYYDTVPVVDTAISISSIIEESDSATIVNETVNIVVTQKRTIYADKDVKKDDFAQRNLSESIVGDSQKLDIEKRDADLKIAPAKKKRESGTSQAPSRTNLVSTYIRDTLFRVDTILSFLVKFDTVFFENRSRSDTSISNRISYENYGKSVLVKETVEMKVTERKNIFAEKNSRTSASKIKPGNRPRKSGTILTSRLKSTYTPTKRVGKDHIRSGDLKIGYSWFEPQAKYSPRHSEYEDLTERLNTNQQAQNSYGLSFTYLFVKNRLGMEAGLGFSQHMFTYMHHFEAMVKDSTLGWEYYNKEILQYDTTWYINLDTLLQTGDTLFLPSIDSSLVSTVDSTEVVVVDTTFESRVKACKYSYSYLEIPLIAHYSIIDKKFVLKVSAGLIPMFLVSKSGVQTNDDEILFNYGFSLSFFGAAMAGYRINEKWMIFAEPFIKQNMYSAIRSKQMILKPNSWGIEAGISYRLFKYKAK